LQYLISVFPSFLNEYLQYFYTYARYNIFVLILMISFNIFIGQAQITGEGLRRVSDNGKAKAGRVTRLLRVTLYVLGNFERLIS